jgi:hypothetical protein
MPRLTPQTINRMLTPVQVGKLLGVSTDRVRQIALAGELPSMMTPLGRLYWLQDVQELALSREERRQGARNATHG